MTRLRYVLWCCVASASACAGTPDDPAPLEVVREDQPPNEDEEPQGRSLTGDTVGFREAWVNTFVAASGAAIGNVRVDRAELWGQAADTTDVHALGFTGAKFHGQTDVGEALFTIAEVIPLPDDLVKKAVSENNPEDPTRGPSTYLYRVLVQHHSTDPANPWTRPVPLCAGTKLAAFAVPFRGAWKELGARDTSATRFTLSCLGGVVAKCGILWGYKPWRTPKHDYIWDAIDVHQSCVRAARADYCARGAPHTFDGTPIKVTDKLAPQIRHDDGQEVPGRFFEAAYGSAGARCLSHLRWSSMPDECHNITVVPPYMTELPDKTRLPNYCDSADEAYKLSIERGWNVRVFVQSHLNGNPPPD